MPADRTAAALLREVGLLEDGPALWGRPVSHNGPGVFLVELGAPVPTLSVDLAVVGRWIERVPELRLDGRRPAGRDPGSGGACYRALVQETKAAIAAAQSRSCCGTPPEECPAP